MVKRKKERRGGGRLTLPINQLGLLRKLVGETKNERGGVIFPAARSLRRQPSFEGARPSGDVRDFDMQSPEHRAFRAMLLRVIRMTADAVVASKKRHRRNRRRLRRYTPPLPTVLEEPSLLDESSVACLCAPRVAAASEARSLDCRVTISHQERTALSDRSKSCIRISGSFLRCLFVALALFFSVALLILAADGDAFSVGSCVRPLVFAAAIVIVLAAVPCAVIVNAPTPSPVGTLKHV